jgi:hypothetical protein
VGSTYREKLARVERLLTQTPTPAQRKMILRRLAEEVAKDALKLTRAINRVKGRRVGDRLTTH